MLSGPAHAGAIPLKAGTKVVLRVRNFVYSPDARPGKNAVLEVAEPVAIDGAVAIRRWALANARFTQVQDPGSFGRGARISMEADWVTAADGKRVALTAPPLTGAGRNGSVALPVAVRGLWGAIAASGFDAALLAGQILEAAVKADEAVSVQESLQ